LDRWLGKPLVRLGAQLKPRRRLPASAAQIVLLQPTAIGDTVIASGIPAAILKRYPGASLHILHGASNAAAVAMIDAPFTAHRIDFRRPGKVLSALRRIKPDLVIDLTPWPRLTALCAMASGAVTVGYDSEGQGRGRAFDIPVRHRSDRHEIDNARTMAAVFDPVGVYRPLLKTPGEKPPFALPFDRLVLFHTTCGGSRRRDRTWTAANWVELARRLGEDGYIIGFTGTEAEIEDVSPIQRLAAEGAPSLLLAGALTVEQLAYVLGASRGLVSLDTGVVHLASSVNAPVVGLYGPARAARWGPWASRGVGVDSPHPAAGFSSFGFETSPGRPPIMEAITVDAVYAAFKTVAAPVVSAVPQAET
jgi:ADP-heptose:LPS heptosyltransferase